MILNYSKSFDECMPSREQLTVSDLRINKKKLQIDTGNLFKKRHEM